MTKEERHERDLRIQRETVTKSDKIEETQDMKNYLMQNGYNYFYNYFESERPMTYIESKIYCDKCLKQIRFARICMTCTFLVFMFMPFIFYLVGATTEEVLEYLKSSIMICIIPFIVAEILVTRHANKVEKFYKTENSECLVVEAVLFRQTYSSGGSGDGQSKRLGILMIPDKKIISTRYYLLSDYLYKLNEKQPYQKVIAIYNPFRKEYVGYSPDEFDDTSI